MNIILCLYSTSPQKDPFTTLEQSEKKTNFVLKKQNQNDMSCCERKGDLIFLKDKSNQQYEFKKTNAFKAIK